LHVLLRLFALFNGQTTMWAGVPSGVCRRRFLPSYVRRGVCWRVCKVHSSLSPVSPEDERGDSWIAKKVL